MSAGKRSSLLVVLAIGACIFVLSPMLPFLRARDRADHHVTLEKQRKARQYSWLRTLSMAITAYRADNSDSLPYHDEGTEAAFYLLRPYALPEYAITRPRGPEMFDAQDPDNDINGPASFDDLKRKVRNADYDYINLKGLNSSPGKASLIIAAEKTGVRQKSKRYLTLSGQVGEHSLAAGNPAAIVGKWLPLDSEQRNREEHRENRRTEQ